MVSADAPRPYMACPHGEAGNGAARRREKRGAGTSHSHDDGFCAP